MTTFVVAALLFPVFLFVFGRALGLTRLMRLEMANPTLTLVDDASIDSNVDDSPDKSSDTDADAAFAGIHSWLLAQDFRLAAKLEMNPAYVASVSRPRPARYYFSADNTIIALLTPNLLHENGKTYSLLFASRNANQETLYTSNRSLEASFPLGPHIRQQDGYTASDEAQYQLHRQALADFQALPCDDITEALTFAQANTGATLDFWQQSRWIHRGPSSYRLSLKGAWELLRRASKQRRHMRTLPAMQTQGGEATTAASQENFIRDVLAFMQPEKTGGRWRNTLFFLSTLVIFMVLGNFQWSLSTLLILLLVLVIHELGHFLAMRASGYRDVSIFFLPLLGAATTGRHDHASSRQKLVVFLAGPVPGILLGLGLLLVLSGGWLDLAPLPHYPQLFAFIAMLLVINYLNLLPVTPFDGGRVMEILFFSRFPRANFYFYALCVAAFGLTWYFSRDHVLFVLLLVLVVGLQTQWRLARVAALLRPEFGRHPQQDDAIRTLAKALAHPDLKSLPAATRSIVVQPLLARLQQEITPWRVTLAGSVVYAALLALPLVLLLPGMNAGTLLPGMGRMISDHAVDDYRLELERNAAAARTPQQKMTRYSDLANYLLYEDDEAAYRYASQALASITPELDSSPAAADARAAYASVLMAKEEPEKAQALLVEAYSKLQQAHPEEHQRLGQLLRQQGMLLPDTATLAERTLLAEKAYQHFVKSDRPENRLTQGEDLALLLHRQQRDSEAETLLRELTAAAPKHPGYDYWTNQTRVALAWLLADLGRPAESVALMQDIADSKQSYDNTPRALAWAQLLAGRADDARQTLHAAFEAREDDAQKGYESTTLALYQVDEALTWRAGQDAGAADAAKQRLQDYFKKNKLDGNRVARHASYGLQQWPHALAKAELALLQEMGYSDTSQCEPGNDSTEEKKSSSTAAATSSTST